jgi:hypothetical protein
MNIPETCWRSTLPMPPIGAAVTFAAMRCARMRRPAVARLRAGRPGRAPASALALRAKVPCAAHAPRAAPPLALAWPARRCASRLCSELDMLAVAPRLGASRCPLGRCAARRCPRAPWPARTQPCRRHRGVYRETPRVSLRGGRYPGWAIYGAARRRARTWPVQWTGRAWRAAGPPGPARPARRAPESARAARFVHLTRRDCLSGTTAGSEASFAARPRREHRSGVGAKRRPPQHEPLPGTARRDALKPRTQSGQQTTARGRQPSLGGAECFMRRGVRTARWSN